MKRFVYICVSFLVTLGAPLYALAQNRAPAIVVGRTNVTFASLVVVFVGLFNKLAVVAATAAIAFFFWGLVRYITNAGDSKGRVTGRQAIIWGLAGLFLIFALAGVLNFLQQALVPR